MKGTIFFVHILLAVTASLFTKKIAEDFIIPAFKKTRCKQATHYPMRWVITDSCSDGMGIFHTKEEAHEWLEERDPTVTFLHVSEYSTEVWISKRDESVKYYIYPAHVRIRVTAYKLIK